MTFACACIWVEMRMEVKEGEKASIKDVSSRWCHNDTGSLFIVSYTFLCRQFIQILFHSIYLCCLCRYRVFSQPSTVRCINEQIHGTILHGGAALISATSVVCCTLTGSIRGSQSSLFLLHTSKIQLDLIHATEGTPL